MVVNWYAEARAPADVFAFQFFVGPPPTYDFDCTTSSRSSATSTRPFKRRRALSDVDGSSGICKKKRRLRLQLITSRLSLPFSVPASNIVNRGISKIANWAKDRAKVGNSLRQAAIMNRIRREWSQGSFSTNNWRRVHVTTSFAESNKTLRGFHRRDIGFVRTLSSPLPPSPLGLSNYDALDLEDEMDEQNFDDDDGSASIHADFSSINTSSTMEDDEYEYLDDLDGIPRHVHDNVLSLPPDERVVEMLKGADSPNDIRFVRLGMG